MVPDGDVVERAAEALTTIGDADGKVLVGRAIRARRVLTDFSAVIPHRPRRPVVDRHDMMPLAVRVTAGRRDIEVRSPPVMPKTRAVILEQTQRANLAG